MADQILVERMNYKSLQKRSKTTERKEEVSDVTKKDGSVISIRKYKKKKRFGRSLNRRAPALFLSELERKITAIGGVYQEVNTKTFKASQYDHSDGTFKKVSLSERMKNINGEMGIKITGHYLLQCCNDGRRFLLIQRTNLSVRLCCRLLDCGDRP